VTSVHEAPGDYAGGKQGDVLTVEFTVLGIPCLGLNGGPVFRHSEAFSFQIATDTQEETDPARAHRGACGEVSTTCSPARRCFPSLKPVKERRSLSTCQP
jgi:predicted 3-demethylubiquinone-9 3-methyltransferase (glyoxalase superfamily)